MKQIFTSIFKIVFICSMISCNSNKSISEDIKQNLCKHEYYGMWAETFWTYQFHKDGTFTFLCDGHYSINYKETGIYTVLDSFILLVSKTDWPIYDGVLKTKLKYIDENCIRDYSNYYYCSNFDSINYYNQRRYDFEQSTISVLDSLKEVIDAKKRIPNQGNELGIEPHFYYNGITVVNNVELHGFQLFSHDIFDRNTYISLYVKEIPFEVYQHDSRGNRLSLIYRK